ncbi:DNA topoisomerase I, mitochondrial-like [Apostichopus japonicus]|uniref:DNA topoisomerase I, mitochondrial-like n=1 Tax=Stichopus japonicus TaxID=307972 RepID=UPI003AB8E8B9
MTSVALEFSYVALCGTLCYVQFGKHNQTTNTISRRKIVICIFLQVAVVSLLLQGLLYPLFVWNTLHWIMSSDNLSQGGAKRTPANNSEDGARSKGTLKENEDKESSGKDEKPKEEIIEKERRNVNNKGPVLAPLHEPFPPNIKFSYGGNNYYPKLNAEEMDDLYTRMIDHMHTAIKAINKQIFESMRPGVSKDEQKKYDFDVYKYLLEQAKLKIKPTQGGAKRTPANNSEDGARSKGTLKENEDKESSGKDEKPKEEIIEKERRNVNNKGPVLAPLEEPFPPNIKFSYGSENSVHQLKAEEVGDLYTRMIDHMHTAIKEINKQIFESLRPEVSKDEQKKYDFHVYKYLLEQAKLRIKLTQGEKDWMKYETARTLKKRLPKIRDAYKKDWESTDREIRQRGVALYFIDKLTFRAGNKAEEGEAAEEEEEGDEEGAVGCCNLMVKHIMLLPQEGNKCFVEFNFVGKSKVEYQKKVEVEKKVYEKIQEFKHHREESEELFDKLTPTKLNTYLKTQMPRLTTRVFRTCNASITLQDKLVEFTNEALKTVNETHEDRLLLLKRADHQAVQAAAVLCNHKRSTPKGFDKQMEKLEAEVKAKKDDIKNAEKDMQGGNEEMEQLVKSLSVELKKLTLSVEDKKKSEHINVATTLKYYLDPRIRVAWSNEYKVYGEEFYKKEQKWVLKEKSGYKF